MEFWLIWPTIDDKSKSSVLLSSHWWGAESQFVIHDASYMSANMQHNKEIKHIYNAYYFDTAQDAHSSMLTDCHELNTAQEYMQGKVLHICHKRGNYFVNKYEYIINYKYMYLIELYNM